MSSKHFDLKNAAQAVLFISMNTTSNIDFTVLETWQESVLNELMSPHSVLFVRSV